MDTYSHCQIAKVDNDWQIATWLKREDKSVYCRSITTMPSRKVAREFQHQQLLRFSEPSFYQGEGI